MNRLIVSTLAAALLAGGLAEARNKPDERREGAVVGHARDVAFTPDLAKAERSDGGARWTRTVVQPGATFVKLYLTDVNLRAGDELVLRTPKGRVVETITGRGPKDLGSFWALSVPGDTALMELRFRHDYPRAPFRVERLIAGNADLFGVAVDEADRSICSPGDFEDAVCFQGEAGKWANVQASVGVMTLGGNANSSLFCSGSNVSPNNYVLTNYHCVSSQNECNNAEYVFRYYNQTCGGNDPTPDWVSFRCGTVAAFEPDGPCDAAPGFLDFMLTSVEGDPAAQFGYVEPDPTPLVDGEEIYIVQHPAGRPHEITEGSGSDFDVDGTVLRYYGTLDTEGGSSGSPIFRSADDKLVGLHHCGGCSSFGVGNRGMRMTDIYPLIDDFLCTQSLSLAAAGSATLTEVSGNGNSVLEPGETWQFVPAVRNASCSAPATGVSATLSVGSAGSAAVTLIDTAASFGDIAAGELAAAANPVRFQIGPEAVCGDDVVIDIVSIQAGGDVFSGAGGVVTGAIGAEPFFTQFSEGFASRDVADWTIVDGGSGAGPAATWTTTNPGGRSLALTEPYMIVDSDEHGTVDDMDEQLISPAVDVSGFQSVLLQFSHVFRWYVGGPDEQADVDVRSSATAGAWVNVANYSGGSSEGTVTLDLTAYAATDLQVRFRYYNALWDWYWAVDDVFVLGSNGFVCDLFGDTDGDGLPDGVDNCTLVSNDKQSDSDGDAIGNACDPDIAVPNDCIVNFADIAVLKGAFFSSPGDGNWNADADFNGDDAVNFADLGIQKGYFFAAPGPSAAGCN